MKLAHIIASLAAAALLAGCASPPMLLRTTSTGGNAHSRVKVSPTGQVETSGIGIGDTVAFSPGSMKAVVGSPTVQIRLYESGDVTQNEVRKSLAMNRREGAKIEMMKGRLLNGDFFIQDINIDVNSTDLNKYNIDLVLLAFNRGEKAFRGDITIYDLLPPELRFVSVEKAAKYNDRRGLKNGLGAIPIFGLLTLGMDNFSRSSDALDLQHEELGELHKYTFRRLVLEPGQAVGMTLRLQYVPPSPEELQELRESAVPIRTPLQH